MDLGSFIPKKKTESKVYYWALCLEPGWIQAGIWSIADGKSEVLSVSPASAWATDDELVNATDTVLSAAVSEFPEDAKEPAKTVFGVPAAWVTDGQIQDAILEKIKTICSKLSLEPVGFVVLSEAIAHFIKSDEGSPMSAIVVGVTENNLEVSVVRIGVSGGVANVSRSVSVVEDVIEGLSRFATSEPLPSRFILYDGKEGELEDVRQALIGADWEMFEKVKFLHTPKIELFTPEKKVLATALAGGMEIANASSVIKVREQDPIIEPEEEDVLTPTSDINPEDFGFSLGKDISEEDKLPNNPPEVNRESPVTKIDESQKPPEPKPFSKLNIGFMANLKAKLRPLVSKFIKRKPETSQSSGSKKIVISGAVFFVLVIVGGFLAWWFLPKAEVTIYVSPKNLEDTLNISVDQNASGANYEESILPGKVISETVKGEKTKPTTGTKIIGDRAKGEVTLYRSGSQLTIPSGTQISASDLKFTLDNEVTIASGSAGTPGTAKVKVTASNIGSEYNLASGTTFSVGNYLSSDVEAKSEADFSGGSSREINAVSEDDQESLEEELVNELTEDAKSKMEGTLSDEEYLVAESLKSEVVDRDFSAKAGDEATSIRLSLEITVSALVIDKKALEEFSMKVLADEVPSNYVLREDQIDLEFSVAGEEDGVYQLEANIKANLLPDVDSEAIADYIKGKYPSVAEEYLNSIDGFERAEIVLKPRLRGRLGSLPRLAKNIEIIISANK